MQCSTWMCPELEYNLLWTSDQLTRWNSEHHHPEARAAFPMPWAGFMQGDSISRKCKSMSMIRDNPKVIIKNNIGHRPWDVQSLLLKFDYMDSLITLSTSDESCSLLLSHISFSLFIMSALLYLTNPIDDTMIIHLVENPGISYSDILILIPDSRTVYDLIFTLFILLTLSR